MQEEELVPEQPLEQMKLVLIASKDVNHRNFFMIEEYNFDIFFRNSSSKIYSNAVGLEYSKDINNLLRG